MSEYGSFDWNRSGQTRRTFCDGGGGYEGHIPMKHPMTEDAHAAFIDISYVVPVYNAMPYLERCVDSLVGQTLAPERLELIFVDDGSSDGSGAFLDQAAANHPNMKVVHTCASGGPAAPRNRGLSMARGEYVYFCDADDYMERDASEAMLAKARNWDSDVLVVRPKGEGGRNLPKAFGQTLPKADIYGSDVFQALGPCKLFRRSLLVDNGLSFSIELPVWEDQELVARAYLLADIVSVAADRYYCYWVKRADENNVSEKREIVPFSVPLLYLRRMMAVFDELADHADAMKVMAPRVLREGLYWAGKALAREPIDARKQQFDELRETVLPYVSAYCYQMFGAQRCLALKAFEADDMDSWMHILSIEPAEFREASQVCETCDVQEHAATIAWNEGGRFYAIDQRGLIAPEPQVETLTWNEEFLRVSGTAEASSFYGAVRVWAKAVSRDSDIVEEVPLEIVESSDKTMSWRFDFDLGILVHHPDIIYWDFSIAIQYENGRKRGNRVKRDSDDDMRGSLNSLHGVGSAMALFAYRTKNGRLSLCNPFVKAGCKLQRRGPWLVGQVSGVPKRAAELLGAIPVRVDFGWRHVNGHMRIPGSNKMTCLPGTPRAVSAVLTNDVGEEFVSLPFSFLGRKSEIHSN